MKSFKEWLENKQTNEGLLDIGKKALGAVSTLANMEVPNPFSPKPSILNLSGSTVASRANGWQNILAFALIRQKNSPLARLQDLWDLDPESLAVIGDLDPKKQYEALNPKFKQKVDDAIEGIYQKHQSEIEKKERAKAVEKDNQYAAMYNRERYRDRGWLG